ncbi:MAG TPA: SLBB domain-containing protein [Candidatus Acidoferrales bacterium]|nr:SLBB domain-containing protein [Candidatus Acidoferrales bacterium]
MNCGKSHLHDRASQTVRCCTYLAIAVLLACASVAGQSRPQGRVASTSQLNDLARQNLEQVAASAQQIKAVLANDPGLLVDLKEWVANDATQHGQLIEQSDLTDDAIYDRIETDVRFRSVATRLLRRYGYLTPRVDPSSEMGREQALLIEERVKWLAQEDEEGRAQQAAEAQRAMAAAKACGGQQSANCTQYQGGSSRVLRLPQPAESQPESPVEMNPVPSPVQNPPSMNGGELEVAGLSQSNSSSSQGFSNLAGALNGKSGSLDGEQLFDIGGESSASGSNDDSGGSSGVSPQAIQQLEQQFGGGGSPGAFGSAMSGGASAGMPGFGAGFSNGSNNNLMAQLNPFAGDESAGPTPSNIPNAGNERLIWTRRPGEQATLQSAGLVRASNPYRDIPSLYDMYLQAQPHPGKLQRFGENVFENGARNPQMIPMDLPVGPDYVVGPGDSLAIDLWGGVSHRLYRTVDREGRVALPEVGPVLVSGKNLAEVQEDLQHVLRTQFRDVSADVSLSRLRTVRIYEVGDVENPGAYDVSSLSTPLNALFMAGGPTARGSMRIVQHYRDGKLVQTVDLYDLLLHGVKAGIDRLQNGDTVRVPPIGPQVTVEGMVRRPAIYELKDEKNLAQVLELAGGLLPAATLRHIEVSRLVAHQKRTMLSLNVPEADGSAAITKALESFEIRDGDSIRVFPIAPYNQDAIYLEGHVLRPGQYSYRAGMRVTDLISSYKDLLPEPALKYAEIIRLNAPDFHPSVQSFSLADALAHPDQSPVLHPLDTVRIFSKFAFENPPAISVLGDVRDPGTYRTSGQIHLSDAVHLAGGLTPDAETHDAQVFRYLPDGKSEIFSVDLSEALSGNPSANILLESRDRLLVHRSPATIQPAVVYIEGAVGKPGRYPLTENMTLGDLIRLGGGLKPSADTQTADLTRYSWQNGAQVTASEQTIPIADTLAGNASTEDVLHNGDVLTIRQLPGWDDLGASVTIRGEVKHPGTYGIRPGERLSSVLERAGGFQPEAYPYGAILQRVSVREIETRQRTDMIGRVKGEQANLDLIPASTQQQKAEKEMVMTQWQSTLEKLSTNPPTGRVDIHIFSNIHRWRNTDADIAVRGGDVLTIPKRPDYVMVTGQVFNPTAVSYSPGRSAKWYLMQSGGPTQMADKKAIFVIRANGSVLSSKRSLWLGHSLSSELEPGDTVVVPERGAPVGGIQWQNIFTAGQMASAIATTLYIALHY